MEKVNKILSHPKYKKLLEELKLLEKNRIFCKHSLIHFLDVARIAYIEVLEKGLNYKKEVIYAIALLHDIGRVIEYKEGIPHNIASAELAREILKDIEFSEEDKDMILKCIIDHRNENTDCLSKIIYDADKFSRNCFDCVARDLCKWSEDKKNKIIKH
ncbi:HD domain-containing protein [Caproiciproducens sp. MSJ-32]|uniref:HD domain-containing protein n=1 Tax=Caproiciproducens sp. MSJ-32 TaxID=2841527 RepID=UPI001C11C47E|nr:HD domain-containing protein [Caproiciproducens sp. MSJ-32]MBU5454410.1 HD domain-containing protein [Caproiciproducens sp. MSJ-32]